MIAYVARDSIIHLNKYTPMHKLRRQNIKKDDPLDRSKGNPPNLEEQ